LLVIIRNISSINIITKPNHLLSRSDDEPIRQSNGLLSQDYYHSQHSSGPGSFNLVRHASPRHNITGRNQHLTKILFQLVFVFMICHSLRFFLAFYMGTGTKKDTDCYPEWLWPVSSINHLLLITNSSINFIIYCVAGTKFRKALHRKFPCLPLSGVPENVNEMLELARTSRTSTSPANSKLLKCI